MKKSLTIRYDEIHEKEINKLKDIVNESTMSKAFLKTPLLVQEQAVKMAKMSNVIEDQRDKIEELESIIENWKIFNKKLDNFLNKR